MTVSKIHPNPWKNGSCSSGRETYTLWMKSLVFHGNGCTVFDSRGHVVFRVDNYQQRCSRKVILMDSNGKLLFCIRRKKMGILGCWQGYKRTNDDDSKANSKQRPWFQVTRNFSIFLNKNISLSVALKDVENNTSCYRIIGLEGKSALKIIDFSGQLLAEAVPKQSSEGVSFGEDVLTLMVEPQADQALVMALVTVYGLINNKL